MATAFCFISKIYRIISNKCIFVGTQGLIFAHIMCKHLYAFLQLENNLSLPQLKKLM